MSVKSFFTNVFNFLTGKSATNATSVLSEVKTFVAFATPIAETLTTLIGGASNGGEAATIIARINTVLGTLTTLSTSASNITSISTALNALTADLASLLSLVGVKNSGTVSTITTSVNLISGELAALLSQIPATK